jgi:hypothetical protein
MTSDTYQRQAGRAAQTQSLASRRGDDRDEARGRRGRPFHRSTWSAYMAGLVGGATDPTRFRSG